ncbi:MAG: hypothetical protein V1729_00735 [Candidatus Woesearchaeota archaeon]
MKRLSCIIILSVLILGLISVAGCSAPEPQYICASGKITPVKEDCKTNRVSGVTKKDAESYSSRYVTAFFAPYGGKSQLVSSYLEPDEGDYYSTFIVSEKDGTPYETVVKVDGMTSKVACYDKCDYVK